MCFNTISTFLKITNSNFKMLVSKNLDNNIIDLNNVLVVLVLLPHLASDIHGWKTMVTEPLLR